ncbi:hypothetical protein LXM60_24365 [Pandoraea sputorum]|uniref:hypothetical protein n=1 Tax=Pandoraea sputorum TaxID=93222 RepID=UPI001E37C055|nr:hypothetical protein [Pandoraea sputorum]MCE4063342.1 hypothetical protein [Pandoraea sputorum]
MPIPSSTSTTNAAFVSPPSDPATTPASSEMATAFDGAQHAPVADVNVRSLFTPLFEGCDPNLKMFISVRESSSIASAWEASLTGSDPSKKFESLGLHLALTHKAISMARVYEGVLVPHLAKLPGDIRVKGLESIIELEPAGHQADPGSSGSSIVDRVWTDIRGLFADSQRPAVKALLAKWNISWQHDPWN